MQVNIGVEFKNGIGHIDATLIRAGATISGGSLRRTGTITFNNASSGDTISLDGVCSGTADLNIDVPITPAPQSRNYKEGDIFDDFDIV